MIDDHAKTSLHDDLRWIRRAIVSKLDGLSEYDARRPLTVTGTNLLDLVKHLSIWESRYLGEVFDRPFPEPLPRWNESERGDTMWATEHETRIEIIDRYRRVWGHADILREQLDGIVGIDGASAAQQKKEAAFWDNHCAKMERAAIAAAAKSL